MYFMYSTRPLLLTTFESERLLDRFFRSSAHTMYLLYFNVHKPISWIFCSVICECVCPFWPHRMKNPKLRFRSFFLRPTPSLSFSLSRFLLLLVLSMLLLFSSLIAKQHSDRGPDIPLRLPFASILFWIKPELSKICFSCVSALACAQHSALTAFLLCTAIRYSCNYCYWC